ncbi:hypothetical protein [Nostoc sp. CHAB 5715]|uniref:hypothetical protein n=1 Tax=Nostoc sp. CHAB 5715 TaxID=2780400 RepID=UPI001E2A9B38|nr:hypothetical protein [Nostoc sp. CHAB 5715]MCC5619989.1 hypothetical protein [Nostoc sp. CHAB 5715]
MPSFLSILEGLSKANKVFTIVNGAFDASMTGVQIAQAVDPNSVCVAWNVGSLTETAFAEGKKYDILIDRLSNISADMENIRQAIYNLQDIAKSLEDRWINVNEIWQKLDEENRKLSLKVPSAQKWLTDLQSKGISSEDQIKELAKALKISATDVAIPSTLLGITIISMVGEAVYNKYYRTRDPLANLELLSNSLDPKWRLKEAGKAAVTTIFNLGSFAMNIYLVVKLTEQCKAQADKLNEMISTYNSNTPTLDALIHGCKNDQTKLKAVEDYLKKSSPDLSFNDQDSQQLLNDGLEVALSNYNINVKGWLTDLDQVYQTIQKAITAAANQNIPGISQDLATTITSRYNDFKSQEAILNETDTKKKTANERLLASREVVKIISETISSATNHIVEQYKVALVDTKVQTFLINKAGQIANKPSRLEEFNADKEAYVKDEGFLSDLNQVFPERTLFKDSDENKNISDIANYLDKAIQDILHPKTKDILHPKTKNITYNFLVNVISGSLKGKQFSGFFSYDPSLLKGKGQETITVLEAEFNYLSKYTHKDGIPSISFTDGNFERFTWVNGKTTERFGFNDGFGRTQFGRTEEAFIRNGKDYFGYLDKNTYVDGAGTITYASR